MHELVAHYGFYCVPVVSSVIPVYWERMSVMQQGSLQSQYFSTINGLTVDQTCTLHWHYPWVFYSGISSPQLAISVFSPRFLSVSLLNLCSESVLNFTKEMQ